MNLGFRFGNKGFYLAVVGLSVCVLDEWFVGSLLHSPRIPI